MRQGRSLPGFETSEGKTYGLRRGEWPPAALALARLVGETIGERLWREAMAEVERQAQERLTKTE